MSKADIPQCPCNIRFTPESGHWLSVLGCLLIALRNGLRLRHRFTVPRNDSEIAVSASEYCLAISMKGSHGGLPPQSGGRTDAKNPS